MYKYSVMKPTSAQKRRNAPKQRVRKSPHKKPLSPRFIRGILNIVKLMAFIAVLGWGGTYGLHWIKNYYHSNQVLLLKNIVTQGNGHLSQSNLMNLIGIDLGHRMMDIPVKKIEEDLEAHPWIAAAEVKRLFPSTLKIQIREKTPIAAFCNNRKGVTNWYGLSAEGLRLPSLDRVKYDLPVVEVQRNHQDSLLAQIGTFLNTAKQDFPGIYHSISQVAIQRDNEVLCFSREGGHRVRLSLEESYEETLYIWKLMFNKHRKAIKKGRTIDLRVRGFAYVS